MARWVSFLVDYIRDDLASSNGGGNVILLQIENEYGDVLKYHGEAGKKYMQWTIDFANTLKTGIPWIMCQGEFLICQQVF